MSIAEGASHDSAYEVRSPAPPGPVVMDTSEVRWFAPGSVPPDVMAWFVEQSTITAVDERCDTYVLHGIDGLGVKYRGRRVLELKRRHSIGTDLMLDAHLRAPLMRWQKWQPRQLDEALSSPDFGRLDVHKVVLKSSLASVDGSLAPTDLPNASSSATCNIELASVVVGDVESWTFAFEVSGPPALRRSILLDAWETVRGGTSSDIGLGGRFEVAASYPAWLETSPAYRLAG